MDLSLWDFKTHENITSYLSSPDYQQSPSFPGLCFAFSITESVKDDIDVKLVFSGQFQDPNTQSIPSQLDPAWSEFDINADDSSFGKYTTQGYSLVQNWLANHVFRHKANNPNATMAVTLVPFKTDKYISDDFSQIMSGISLPALIAIKESVNRAWECSLAEGVKFERHALYARFASDDAHEGMHAFLEKRKPEFQHR